MSTNMRPEISERNPYWIPRERYYELKHFCRQYPVWKKAYNTLDGLSKRPSDSLEIWKKHKNGGHVSDPTARIAEAKANFSRKIEMVENCIRNTDSVLYPYIIKYVTIGCSYDALKVKDNIPCGRDFFYDRIRKFFWFLSKERG